MPNYNKILGILCFFVFDIVCKGKNKNRIFNLEADN